MKVLNTKVAYSCPILNVEERLVESNGKSETHYVVVRQPNVTILALDKNGKFILIQQPRGKDNNVYTELPSGKLNVFNPTTQELESQAKLELKEETGYKANMISLAGKVSTNTNWLERDYYIFIAWDLEKGEQEFDGIEDIEIIEVDPESALSFIKDKLTHPNEKQFLEIGIDAFKEKKLI
ncbi:MAG: NUDIX hydrolase [Candidatus Dojkabacteria bacterium]|nr:NUDIX hydrolase [Candidatus Dojkabacteria bacterium]MDQ7020653.1 NUDIX hydrolase [Candidatus Dojkabacteria bacterium]